MLINEISSLDEVITKYRDSPAQLPLKVVDGSEVFDFLNNCSDGVVGHNHTYYHTNDFVYLIYYTLSDSADFVILEVRRLCRWSC